MALSVDERGEGDAVVVLPPFGLDGRATARALEPAFAGTVGWARLYLDLPGTGRSAPCEPTSDAVVGLVAETLDAHLGERPYALLGWSYGGYLAAGLTRRRPSRVTGLMSVCSGPRIRPEDRDLSGVGSSSPEDGWLRDVPLELHDHFERAIGRQRAAVARRVAAVIAESAPADESFLASLRGSGFALGDDGVPTPCAAPARLVAGGRDRIAGFAWTRAMLEGLAEDDVLVVGSAGHYLPLEVPGRFAATLRGWLARCSAGSRPA